MPENDAAPAEPSSGAPDTQTTTGPALTPAMRTTLITAGALLAVALVVWVGLLIAPAQSTSVGADSSSTSTPTPTSTDPGPLPDATPWEGSEVLPPSAESPGDAPLPGEGLPPLPSPTPLVTPPLPESASASGKLVEGYPTAIMGPAPGSDVLSSSIATEGDRMQVSLVARTDASADDIRSHYQQEWAKLGLTDSGSTDGTVAYANSLTSLTLAFSAASGTGTIYNVYGVFRTG